MISRSALSRNAQQAARRSYSVGLTQARGFASAASSGAFEVTDANGIKVASRDTPGPTTTLAIVGRGGTRYQPFPGLSMGLESYAFKSTKKRTALRINREAELFGGQLFARYTREAFVLGASFLNDDLPYFTELLAEVATQTKYTTHELHEEIEPVLDLRRAATSRNVAALALDNAHAVAFHTGLGAPLALHPGFPSQQYINEEFIATFADYVYNKPSIAIVTQGTNSETLSGWVNQFFQDFPATSESGVLAKTEATKYFGGEQRIANSAGNSMVIAFPGSDIHASKPEIAVLAALFGSESPIKWSPGFSYLSKEAAATHRLSASASSLSYSDSGLLVIQLTGYASAVRLAALDAVKALKNIAEGSITKEDLTKAIANAKFDVLDKAQLRDSSILLAGYGILNSGKPLDMAAISKSFDSVTVDKLKTAAKTLLNGKATVCSVGDTFLLPYAAEMGLNV